MSKPNSTKPPEASASPPGAFRVACCVPFCRRTFKVPHPQAERLCWEHFKRIPLDERRALWRAWADAHPDRVAEKWPKPPRWLLARRKRVPQERGYPWVWLRYDRLWKRAKRRAIELADLGSFRP